MSVKKIGAAQPEAFKYYTKRNSRILKVCVTLMSLCVTVLISFGDHFFSFLLILEFDFDFFHSTIYRTISTICARSAMTALTSTSFVSASYHPLHSPTSLQGTRV